ncbi:MAG: TetR/AcrR family transcriptional regulator [Pseudomonadota bacterium]
MRSKRLDPEERRQAFLDVGLEAFGNRSFDDVSVKEICETVGVSRRLFEHYFGSKKSFFLTVIRHALAGLDQRIRRPITDNPLEDLEPYLRELFEFMLKHPQASLLVGGATGVAEAQKLVDEFNNEATERMLSSLPERMRSTKVKAAIECWRGVNTKLLGRLLQSPDLTVEWAAAYSSAALKFLVTEAAR